ncbi:MAG: hypothetical protein AAF799_27485 [Myxococcota bacterium]
MNAPARILLGLAPIAALGLVAAAPGTSSAYIVDQTNDSPSVTPIDCSVCESVAGGCTLRAAVETANACNVLPTLDDRIDFDTSAPILLTIPGSGTSSAATGDLDVTSPLVVSAPAQQFVMQTAMDRIWDVHAPLTLENINTQDGMGTDDGGCLRNDSGSLLTLTNSSFWYCNADNNGGAVYSDGPVIFDGGVVAHSRAGNNGGGIFVINADADIFANVISKNMADNNGGNVFLWESGSNVITANIAVPELSRGYAAAGHGGSLYTTLSQTFIDDTNIERSTAERHGGGIYSGTGMLTIHDSAIFDNESRSSGGGISKREGDMLLRYAAVYGNDAEHSGGAIELWARNGRWANASLENVTIGQNTADYQGGAVLLARDTGIELHSVTMVDNVAGSYAGGIAATSNSYGARINRVAMSGNAAPVGPDCTGDVEMFPGTESLVSDTSGCNVMGSGAYLNLPLQHTTSGFGLSYHAALLPGSPALDVPGVCLPDDQFHTPRSPTLCELGAFEQ